MNAKYIYAGFGLLMLSAPSVAVSSDEVSAALANICNIVQADDKSELRKKLKVMQDDYNMKLQDYYDGISCSGNSLIRTAVLSNATESGVLLVKKLPKSALTKPENDGQSLAEWIATSGQANSEIGKAIAERS